MEAAIKGALVRRATLYKDISSPLLAQLEVLAGQHGLDAKGIATAFDKFMTTSRAQSTSGVTPEDLEAFAEHFGKAGRQPDIQARPNNLFARGPSWEDATVGGLLGGSTSGSAATTAQPSQRISPYLSKQTPRPGSAAKPRTPASSGKFRERLQGGEVQAVLNSHIQAPAERMDVDAAGACCEVEVLGAALRADAKYMMNRIEDKVDHLERRLTGLEEALEARGLELTSVAYAAQDQTVFVGRVCCDTEEGRLNQESALLEGSVRSSQGARVRLDLSRCPTFRLFPGQVVAVKGINPSGQCIVASEVVGGLPLPMPTTSLQQKAAHASATGKRGLSAVIAAGPFTSSEDLGYEALHALLAHCSRTRPDLLLLVGPFVDAEHPAVRGGLLEETFDEVFEGQVMGQLAAFIAANSGTRVMLMPAVRDVHHHPVFPQPPLPPSQGEPPVTNLPSPATVRCNEVVVGCSSADWLVACSGQEISRTAGQTDRLAALASHLISQRSYMPMFPPPASLPLDSANSPALELPCTPDLLVLPSDLQPFAKLVPLPATTLAAPVAEAAAAPALVAGAHAPSAGTEAAPMETDSAAAAGQQAGAGAPVRVGSEGSVVCINPGRLVKGTNGGTFAHVYIPPSPEALALLAGQPASTNSPLPHRVDQRCRVEIRKI